MGAEALREPPPAMTIPPASPDEPLPKGDGEATKPALPPGLASMAGKSVDEVWAELNCSPLFMTQLEENDDTAALQALSYEGSPWKNAADFKARGNDSFQARSYADAKEFYTRGVAILAAEQAKRATPAEAKQEAVEHGDEERRAEVAREEALLETLYVNRAACHLALANYRSCWLDAAAALRLNEHNSKAYYRGARALLAVDHVAEAHTMCARGLALSDHDGTSSAALHDLAAAITLRADTLAAEHARKTERRAAQQQHEARVAAALASRGIRTRRTTAPPDLHGSGSDDARITLVADPDADAEAAAADVLAFPVTLLYPLRRESDLIRAFAETHTLADHLAYVLPPPWDDLGAYRPDAVSCFVQAREAGPVLKLGKRVPLGKLLAGGPVEVVDQLVRVFVVPTDRADAWLQEFKAMTAAANGSPLST